MGRAVDSTLRLSHVSILPSRSDIFDVNDHTDDHENHKGHTASNCELIEFHLRSKSPKTAL